MNSDAMGVYPLNRHNKEKLRGCEYKKTEYNDQIQGQVFIFNDSYRKLNIDLIFTEYGELYISDFYGNSMERSNIFYVKLNT